MKKRYVKNPSIILVVFIALAVVSSNLMIYVFTYRGVMEDVQQRARGARDYIVDSMTINDIQAIIEGDADTEEVYSRLMAVMRHLQNTADLRQLYIAYTGRNGEVATALNPIESGYNPDGQLAEDLGHMLRARTLIARSGFYDTRGGRVYCIFWPMVNMRQEKLGVVCMEFSVENMFSSFRIMMTYSASISLMFIVLFSLSAYIFMKRSAEKIYKELAYIDVATGFKNRMAFEHQLNHCNELITKGKPFAIMAFDLNNLKYVNDNFGHESGDNLIKNTAKMIAENLGKPEFLYRIGGDEFAAIITGSSMSNLEELYIKIQKEDREAIEGFKFSCAVGIAQYQEEKDETSRDVLKRADERMYENKSRMKSRGEAMQR